MPKATKKDLHDTFKEWSITVPQRWWEMLSVPLSFVPLLAGVIAFAIWARNITPPLPWWDIALVVGGAILFLVVSFLAFHRVRMGRDKEKEQIEQLKQIKDGDVISGKDINVSLMFQQLNSNPIREAERHNILDNVTFDHCNLHGPCLITFEGEWEISDCGFFGIGKIKANIPLQQATEGLGKFVHCRFRFCNFHNMSFYLIEKDMAEFSKIRKP
jgi:hypothetical protein